MPIYDETWGKDDYVTRTSLYVRDLPKNHLLKLDGLPFSFTQYKAHRNIPCYIYERMVIHCINQYGIDYQRNKNCNDAQYYFKYCRELNQAIGHRKKYYPQQFVINPISRNAPHIDQVL